MTSTILYDDQTFALQQYGGISRYFCELATRVQREPGFGARVVAPLHFNDHLSSCEAPHVGLRLPMPHPRLARLVRGVNRLAWPLIVRAARPSLVHRTYYATPPLPEGVPSVVTVFDMIHELFADHFSPRDPTTAAKRRAVERADRVLCISKSTADDLMRLFDVPARKISITYLGYSAVFERRAPAGEAAPHPRPYLLYVGHRGGYKNFELALRAYASSARLREAFDFVAFGGVPFTPSELALVRELRLPPERVPRLAGSDDDLARAYRHARLFVYPSLYEGFGIPPLEAMASDCPVACANTSSIPEVVGEAAAMFDPRDPEAVRAALERVALGDTLRDTLVRAGREQVRRFSWDHCARQTLDAYRQTLGVRDAGAAGTTP